MARDLTYRREISESVERSYRAIDAGAGEAAARRIYSEAELAELPPGAIGWALGVANPVRYAFLRPGETVLDIGSGGGIDTILSANRVGPSGRAIGLDPLDTMRARGRAHASEAGVGSFTEFIPGEMEDIPLAEGSIDVVISNGVLNLSARKSRAMAEIYRVLRPGGRICLGDLTLDSELPIEVATDPSAWAGWVSGALAERVFADKLERAGFQNIWVGGHRPFGIADAAQYPLFTPEVIEAMRRTIPPERQDHVATAVIVKAERPEGYDGRGAERQAPIR